MGSQIGAGVASGETPNLGKSHAPHVAPGATVDDLDARAAVSATRRASAPFNQFIETLTGLVSEFGAGQEAALLSQGGEALATLLAEDDWLPPAYAQPSSERYQQFLLYRDPDARFSVVSFVWGPGQRTPIHDHTVWGLIGMLRGGETSVGFARGDSGAIVATGEVVTLHPGHVDAVSPTIGDIHRVTNLYDDAVSISIHVYGADIGQVERWVYPEDGGAPKRFVSGYSNGALPPLLI